MALKGIFCSKPFSLCGFAFHSISWPPTVVQLSFSTHIHHDNSFLDTAANGTETICQNKCLFLKLCTSDILSR